MLNQNHIFRTNIQDDVQDRGGSFSIQKFMLQILRTLNGAFWAWNWYKIVISEFRVCFFNNCVEENQNKTHFEEGNKNSQSSLRDGSRYQIGWIFGVTQQLTTTPHPSEWSLSLEIICMHFILSSHHTSYSIPILFFCGSQTACDIDGDFLSCLWWSTTLIYLVVLKGKAPLNISKSFLLVILSLMRNFLRWRNMSELYLLLVYNFLINWSGPKYANPVFWWRLC